jgi:hypothetical protein
VESFDFEIKRFLLVGVGGIPPSPPKYPPLIPISEPEENSKDEKKI